MASSWFMIFVRKTMLLLLRTNRVLISTPTQSGTFNGSAKVRETKVKVWSAFQLMVALLNGP